MKKIFLCLLILFMWMVGAAHALPVFPGAEGFGSATVAGRGGTIYHVTTLADSGTGSLREAISASGSRIVVFDVGGTINLNSDLRITNGNITVAGQTAPGDGIMLRNYGLRITASNVLVQHLAVRPGDDGRTADGSWDNLDALQIIAGVYNVVVDHCSFSWAVDENSSIWASGAHDITLSNNIISEALVYSAHTDGKHSKGFLSGGSSNNPKNVSLIKNLFAHNQDRNPQLKGGTSTVIANNVIYNYGGLPWETYGSNLTRNYVDAPHEASFIGNVYKEGPDTPDGCYAIDCNSTIWSGTEIYENDNINLSSPSYMMDSQAESWRVGTPPLSIPGFTALSSSETLAYVLENVGSRPAYRDSVDDRIANPVTGEVITGTGTQRDHSSGLWPTYSTTYSTFDVGSNPGGDDDSDGYTNIEELLHAAAAAVEGEGTLPPPPPPPDPVQHSTTFGDYSTGVQPSDWTDYGSTGSWTVDADTGALDDKVLSHDDVTSGRFILLWDQPGSITGDVQAMVKVRVNAALDNTGPGAGRVIVHGGGSAGNESGYMLGVRSNLDGNIGLAKYVSGSYSELGSSSGHTFIAAGEWIWLKLDYDADTDTLCGKAWDDGGSEPGSCDIQLTDTSLSSGRVGVSDWSAASKADYDFFSVGTGGLSAPAPPPEQGQGSWDTPQPISGLFTIN